MDKKYLAYTYSGILLSNKKKLMPSVATWMELERLILSEIQQREKDKYQKIQRQTLKADYRLETCRNKEGKGNRGVGESTREYSDGTSTTVREKNYVLSKISNNIRKRGTCKH